MPLLDLPDLCVREVALLLARALGDGERVALLAASAELNRAFAPHFYDAVDPGCVLDLDELRAVHRSGLERLERAAGAGAEGAAAPVGPAAVPPRPPNPPIRLISLRAACAAERLPTSGTKAVLLARLSALALDRAAEREAERDVALALLADRAVAAPPSWIRCPVRARVRAAVRATLRDGAASAADPVRQVTLTHARGLGLDDEVIGQLRCEVRPNPYYRRGPAMRLYRESDVLGAVLAVRGPGRLADSPETAVPDPGEALERGVSARMRERHVARRRAEADALLEGAGLTEALLAESRVGAYPLVRYVHGSGSASALRRMVAAARAVLDAQAARREHLRDALQRTLLSLAEAGRTAAAVVGAMPRSYAAAGFDVRFVRGVMPEAELAALLAEAEGRIARRAAVRAELDAVGCAPAFLLHVAAYERFLSGRGPAHELAAVIRYIAESALEARFFVLESPMPAQVHGHAAAAAAAAGAPASWAVDSAASEASRMTALVGWLRQFGSAREALGAPALPATLRPAVRRLASLRTLLLIGNEQARAAGLPVGVYSVSPAIRPAGDGDGDDAGAAVRAAADRAIRELPPADTDSLDPDDVAGHEAALRQLLRRGLAKLLRARARRAFMAALRAPEALAVRAMQAFEERAAAAPGWRDPPGDAGGAWLAPFDAGAAEALGAAVSAALAAVPDIAREMCVTEAMHADAVARAATADPAAFDARATLGAVAAANRPAVDAALAARAAVRALRAAVAPHVGEALADALDLDGWAGTASVAARAGTSPADLLSADPELCAHAVCQVARLQLRELPAAYYAYRVMLAHRTHQQAQAQAQAGASVPAAPPLPPDVTAALDAMDEGHADLVGMLRALRVGPAPAVSSTSRWVRWSPVDNGRALTLSSGSPPMRAWTEPDFDVMRARLHTALLSLRPTGHGPAPRTAACPFCPRMLRQFTQPGLVDHIEHVHRGAPVVPPRGAGRTGPA